MDLKNNTNTVQINEINKELIEKLTNDEKILCRREV